MTPPPGNAAPLEVRLYALDCRAADAARLERCVRLLDAAERERAARFVFEHHRRRFVLAHGFLREALARETGRDPARLAFRRDPGGKPRLVEGDVRFSLTHSGEHALLACSTEELGLDAEQIRPARVESALAERVMTPDEFACFARASRADQLQAFFRLWSAKESVMKACGLGLALAPSSFAVLAPSTLELAQWAREPAGKWRLAPLSAPEDYTASLATPREARVVHVARA